MPDADRLIDFAYSRPSPSAIKTAGFAGVIRYLSSDPFKAISPSEADSYHLAGLTVTLVYEDAANDAEGGAAAGRAKAGIAKPQLRNLGVPIDRPVYFAVDENLAPQKYGDALSCVTSFAAFLGRPPACYGSRPFLAFAKENGVSYLYEAGAAQWNTGPAPAHVQLHQEATQAVVDGSTVDVDIASATDYGQWPRPVSTPRPPPPGGPDVKITDHRFRIGQDGRAAFETNVPFLKAFAPTILEGIDQMTFAQPPRVANASGHAVIVIEGATAGAEVTVRLAEAP